jgi:hypothetical protein
VRNLLSRRSSRPVGRHKSLAPAIRDTRSGLSRTASSTCSVRMLAARLDRTARFAYSRRRSSTASSAASKPANRSAQPLLSRQVQKSRSPNPSVSESPSATYLNDVPFTLSASETR